MHPAQDRLMDLSLMIRKNPTPAAFQAEATAALPFLQSEASTVPAEIYFRYQSLLRRLADCVHSAKPCTVARELHELAAEGAWNQIWYANYLFSVFGGRNAPEQGGVYIIAAKKPTDLAWTAIAIGGAVNMHDAVTAHGIWESAQEIGGMRNLGPLHVHAMKVERDREHLIEDLCMILKPVLHPHVIHELSTYR